VKGDPQLFTPFTHAKSNIILSQTNKHSYQLALSNAGEFQARLKMAPDFFSLLQQDSEYILLFNR
jgi:hypothetical protein